MSHRERKLRSPRPMAPAASVAVACVLAALCAGAASAAPPPAAKPAAGKSAYAPANASGKKPAATPAPASPRTDAMRTLDAIHIEGEIAVPQVLFITARDVRRFRDGVGSSYQPCTLDVARSVSLPHRLRVVACNELNKEEGK